MIDYCVLKFFYILVFNMLLCRGQDQQAGSFGFCVDELCSAPISFGHTTLAYNAPREDVLSFQANDPVTVFALRAGVDKNLLGVEIGRRRGYIPEKFFREHKRVAGLRPAVHPASIPFFSMPVIQPTTSSHFGDSQQQQQQQHASHMNLPAPSVPPVPESFMPQLVSGSVPQQVSGSVPQQVSGSVPQQVSGSVPQQVSGSVPQPALPPPSFQPHLQSPGLQHVPQPSEPHHDAQSPVPQHDAPWSPGPQHDSPGPQHAPWTPGPQHAPQSPGPQHDPKSPTLSLNLPPHSLPHGQPNYPPHSLPHGQPDYPPHSLPHGQPGYPPHSLPHGQPEYPPHPTDQLTNSNLDPSVQRQMTNTFAIRSTQPINEVNTNNPSSPSFHPPHQQSPDSLTSQQMNHDSISGAIHHSNEQQRNLHSNDEPNTAQHANYPPPSPTVNDVQLNSASFGGLGFVDPSNPQSNHIVSSEMPPTFPNPSSVPNIDSSVNFPSSDAPSANEIPSPDVDEYLKTMEHLKSLGLSSAEIAEILDAGKFIQADTARVPSDSNQDYSFSSVDNSGNTMPPSGLEHLHKEMQQFLNQNTNQENLVPESLTEDAKASDAGESSDNRKADGDQKSDNGNEVGGAEHGVDEEGEDGVGEEGEDDDNEGEEGEVEDEGEEVEDEESEDEDLENDGANDNLASSASSVGGVLPDETTIQDSTGEIHTKDTQHSSEDSSPSGEKVSAETNFQFIDTFAKAINTSFHDQIPAENVSQGITNPNSAEAPAEESDRTASGNLVPDIFPATEASNIHTQDESAAAGLFESNLIEDVTPSYVDDASYSAFPTRSILQENDENSSNVDDNNNELTKDEIVPEDTAVPEDFIHQPDETVDSSVLVSTFSNFVSALRTFLEYVISFIPEPLYSYLMTLDASGLSSRAVVFTGLMAFPCLFLFLGLLYLKQSSQEHNLIVQLTQREHEMYLCSSERDVLREDAGSFKEQIADLEQRLEDDRNLISTLQSDLQDYKDENQNANMEQKENLSEIHTLRKQSEEYRNTIADLEKLLNEANKKNEKVIKKLEDEYKMESGLNQKIYQLQEEIESFQCDREAFLDNEKAFTEKIAYLENNYKIICEEADTQNSNIQELTGQLQNYTSINEDLEDQIRSKEAENTCLQQAVLNMEVLQKLKDSGEADDKALREKLSALLDISSLQNKLKKAEQEVETLLDKLKGKVIDYDELKAELLESNSKVQKFEVQSQQAVEDRIKAESELAVLSKYFKEKEVQLQKELGTQETVRHQKEMDVSQAQRLISHLEEENASYKLQISSMRMEIEETERNLKKQIATQEESAHKNWVAARAAERKAEEFKQEVAQFRQRITLLERERENQMNSTPSDIMKPIPQRISDSLHDMSQDSNMSGDFKPDFMFPRRFPPPGPPPMMHPMMPLHGPPPMMPPPFLPPFEPMMPRPPMMSRRPQPWQHMLPDKNPDFDLRNTPSDFDSSSSSRRHHTPPIYDREGDKHSSSPAEERSHSRDSSPLPDFHNVPPSGSRHPDFSSSSRHSDFPPPLRHSRFAPPPSMVRRDQEFSSLRPGNRGDRESNNYRGDSHNTSQDRDYESTRQHYDGDV